MKIFQPTLSGSVNASGSHTINGTLTATNITASTGFSGGSFTGTTISGTIGQLTTLTASSVTGTDAKFNYVDYNNAAYSGGSTPALVEGRLFYDQNNLSLTEITDQGTLINLGKQLTLRVRNSTGATLSKGKIVRITGNNGNTPSVNTASWDNDSTSANTLAVVMADISDNQFGYVLLTGLLKGVNTNGMTSGQMLYLSSSGDYTNVTPSPQYHEVRIGQVIDPGNNGTMFVRIQNGYELNELHDVDAASPAFGDLLSWTSNGGNNQWRNTKQLTGSYGLTGSLSATGQISGSSFVGVGTSLTLLTASNIQNFTTDVRGQFSAGTGIAINSGQISASNVPNASLANSAITINGQSVSLGGTITTVAAGTNLTSNTLNGTVTLSMSANPSVTSVTASGFSGGSFTGTTVSGTTAQFTSVTASFNGNGASLTSLDAGNISAGTLGITRGGTGQTSTPSSGQLLIGNGSSFSLSTLTAGSNITITNGVGTITIASTGGSSGVTAITSSDTNLVFSATTGSVTGSLSANPTFTTVTASSGFSGSGANITALNANNVSAGTLAIARGGTGQTSTPTNGQLLIGSGSSFVLGSITGSNVTVTNGSGTISIKGKFCQTLVLDKSTDAASSNLAATFYIDSANFPNGGKFVIVGNTELTAATGSVSLQRLNGNGNVTGSATVMATLSSSYANTYTYSTGSFTTSLYQITYSRTAGSGFVFLPYVHVEAS